MTATEADASVATARAERRFGRPAPAVAVIGAIGIAGLLLRLWVVLVYRPTCAVAAPDCYAVGGDARYIQEQANLLADGKFFINPFLYGFDGTVVDSSGDAPLYTVFLSVFSFLGFETVAWHRVVSTLCGLALVVLIGLLARRLAGDVAGYVAAAVAAVHPLLWLSDTLLLSEALYQPLIVVVLWAAYDWIDRPDRRRAVLLGVALGFAALTRAESVTLLAFLVVPLVWWGTKQLTNRDRLIATATIWGVAFAVFAPWVAWNNTRFDHPVTFTSSTGSVLMAGACDSVWSGPGMGYWADCFGERGLVDEYTRKFPGADQPAGPTHVVYDESELDVFNREKALDYTLDNLDRFPQVALARMGRTMEAFRVGHTLKANWAVEGRWQSPSTIGLVLYYVLVPFAIAGAVLLHRAGTRLAPLLSMWPMVLFTSALTFALTRYRVPIDIAMIVLAAAAASRLWDHRRRRSAVPT